MKFREILRSGHPGTLLTSLLYFDFCFAVWVLNGSLSPFIAEEYHLSTTQKGFLASVPVWAGALMRLPLGILAQRIGRKLAAQLNMALVLIGLLGGYFLVNNYSGVIALGVVLGTAGASFGVALSLGAGWYPPKYKGLAMGIAGAGNSGAALALLFAGPLAKQYGWQAVYGLAALPMIVSMVLLQLFAKEPPDQEHKPLGDYLQILVNRDAWIFNLIYMVTFGGFIGLTSFLPTLFNDYYGIPKEHVGRYAAGIILAGSALRVIGGWLADRVGGIRAIGILSIVIILSTSAAATLPASPWVMVALLMICFSAMGAGNGAVFQLVPLRFKSSTAVASSLIGEIGGVAGGFLPLTMAYSKELTGSFAPGFLAGTVLTVMAMLALGTVTRQWTSSWVGAGGKAIGTEDSAAPVAGPHRRMPAFVNSEAAELAPSAE